MPKTKNIRLLHFGLGAVGRNIGRLAQTKANLKSVAAVDIAPDLQGRSLAELLELSRPELRRVKVTDRVRPRSADIAIHTTRSWLPEIVDELAMLMKAGLNVISTAEELVFPSGTQLTIIRKLDQLARRNKVRFLAAGVNPGFVLDLLPALLSQSSANVEFVHARRLVNLAFRRPQLQKKVGLGISEAEFNERCKDKHFGHQGMASSLHLLAAGLGIAVKRTLVSIAPVLAERATAWNGGTIEKGFVIGVEQKITGYVQGKERIQLEVKMVLQSETSTGEDWIEIRGTPKIELRIPGGIRGEEATAANIINLIPRLLDRREPGFCTVLDLPFRVRNPRSRR